MFGGAWFLVIADGFLFGVGFQIAVILVNAVLGLLSRGRRTP